MSSRNTFAGVGSQKTPNTPEMPIGDIMGKFARVMVMERGWGMNSGRAKGADTYFEQGLIMPGRDAIQEGLFKGFLPKRPFNGHTDGIYIQNEDNLARARQILIDNKVYNFKPNSKIPRFITLNGDARKKLSEQETSLAEFHTRNVFQILEETLDKPVKMVVCWTPDGATTIEEYQMGVTGGTGIAIALASALGIPVFNLNRQDHLDRICGFIGMEPPKLILPDADLLQPQLF